ncbi:MAG TPA: ribonuclease R, partial [Parasegetibacter sp.]
FRLVESDYCLVGLRSGRQFRMGDKVTVRIVAANLEKRQLDYEWVITTAIKEEKSSGAEKKKKITIKKSAPKSAKRKKK